ncbi:hypothetical protein ABKV19_002468, partial [Rosa sericea]
RDGRIDHSLPPLENSMIEIDMDDLGENQLSNIDQQLANPANLAKDAENIGVLGRESLLNQQIHKQLEPLLFVQVRETRSGSTLELALLNPTEPHPLMFGTLTSPPNKGMCQSEQAIVCAPSSAELA